MFRKQAKNMDIEAELSSGSSDERSFVKIDVKPQGKSNRSKQRGNPAPCPICGVIISNSYNLTCHLRRHNNDKPFKCDQCPAAFILVTELKRHKVTHSKDRPFKCTLCKKSFKCIEILRIHMDSHGCNEYKCRYCDEKFKNYKLRGNHEMSIHTTSNLKCRYCYKSFSEVKFREEHEQAAHKKQLQSELHKVGVKSDLMNLTESEIANLELNDTKKKKMAKRKYRNRFAVKETANKLLDTNFAYYPCKFCSERFRYRRDQVSHYQERHVEEFKKVFTKCHLCGKLLTTAHFKGHLQAHEGIFPHNCTLCDYKSTRKSDLDNHMVVHTKEYKYKCSYCQKSFRSLGPSLLCEKKHSGKKDVTCNFCDKTFFSGFDLRRHVMAKHKTRKCQFCDFETSDRYLYGRHIVVHRGPKLMNKSELTKDSMCEICGLFFNTSRLLTSHLKVHNINNTNNVKREIICSYCDYKGNSHAAILNHSLSEHPSKVNKCEFCDYSTMNESHFVNHMKHHISNSAQEMYLFASLDKKQDKDSATAHLECFICGFSSSVVENMNNHIDSHKETMKTFEWFCSDTFYQSLKTGSDNAIDSFLDDKSYRTLQIKDLSLPVDLCRISSEHKNIKIESDIPRDENTYERFAKDLESIAVVNEFIDANDFESSMKAESQDSEVDSSIIEINDLSNDVSIKSEVIESNDIVEITDNHINSVRNAPTPVTIKIKKVQCKAENPSIKRDFNPQFKSAAKKVDNTHSSPQVNLNLDFLKNKLQNINGKLFLSLEDLCSLSALNKDSIFQQ